ncbi:hypothetical protein [Pseudarthrobacter sp. PS3-L1]|uniref:hypothetical protein n=1 Tax=Pseudarthrobacter sp. PS3-L1 TaxID=3046207 RepID=UPI0024BBE7E8|nr:hypothetical protein [Pseudarthrobacter sp. PS3-L1]MDJ0321671.1 hypothetical protein [Pseudarthrobacter sp. PS3-L1]
MSKRKDNKGGGKVGVAYLKIAPTFPPHMNTNGYNRTVKKGDQIGTAGSSHQVAGIIHHAESYWFGKPLTPWQVECLEAIMEGKAVPDPWEPMARLAKPAIDYVIQIVANTNRVPHGNTPLIHNGKKARQCNQKK